MRKYATRQDAIAALLAYVGTQLGTYGGSTYAYIVGNLYGWDVHGAAWCDIFVDAAFIQVFGREAALRMTYQYQNCSGAACEQSANYYRQHGAFVHTPQPGDQVFYYAGGGINHTGVVTRVTDATITTVEGNWGNQVQQRTISRGSGEIAGFGRPDWSVVVDNDGGCSSPEPVQQRQYKAGDIVRVCPPAFWYTGQAVPVFVYNSSWIVHSVTGDRVVLNENTEGTRAIMSPISSDYLEPVKQQDGTEQEDTADEKDEVGQPGQPGDVEPPGPAALVPEKPSLLRIILNLFGTWFVKR